MFFLLEMKGNKASKPLIGLAMVCVWMTAEEQGDMMMQLTSARNCGLQGKNKHCFVCSAAEE